MEMDGMKERTLPLLHFHFTHAFHRYAPRSRGAASLGASRLFLHAASLCTSFTTMDAGDAGQHSVWCVRALAELPLQLKQRLAALGWNGANSVDAEVAAAMGPA
jgi:hypothetical protein